MPRSRQKLTEADRAEWARFVGGIAPLPGRERPAVPEPAAPALAPAPAVRRPPAPRLPVAVGDQPGGLDNGSWNRFRSGRLVPQRRLDLHGRTAQRSFHALHAFLHAARDDGIRCVEVITGRGSGEGGGVLRRELPMWLNGPELRPLILAASHPHAGNLGAVRLLLRRRK